MHVDDPLERLAAVRTEMTRLKQSHEAEAGKALTALAGAVPVALTAGALRLMSRLTQRNMNTVVTNVPGPTIPLYAAGREMLEYLPFVPLGPGVRIGVAILSYNGRLGFGVTGDFDTAPDIDVVADGIEAAIATLLDLAAGRPSDAVVDLTKVSQLPSDHQLRSESRHRARAVAAHDQLLWSTACGGQPGDRHPERRTRHVVEARVIADLDRFGIAAVLTADTELQVRLRRAVPVARPSARARRHRR